MSSPAQPLSVTKTHARDASLELDTASRSPSNAVVVGSGAHRYRVVEGFPQLPAGWDLVEAAAVAVDSQDRVYLFNRGAHPVMIFTPNGEFVSAWGESVIARAHGMTIGPDDAVYCVDDLDHTVKKFTPEGQLLMKLGTSGKYSDTGAVTVDYRTIRQAGAPFNFPTDLAIAANGDLYVTDGYGNARVHHFTADGELVRSWGAPGKGPGEFHVPHGIAIDREGRLFVADRENDRIQIFSPDGRYLSEWNQLARPSEVFIDCHANIFVAELGYRSGIWPGTSPPTPDATGGRISVFTSQGELLARWGGGENPCAPGDFFAPHDLWVDARGDLYVTEVVMSAGGNRGLVSPDCHTVQKFSLLENA